MFVGVKITEKCNDTIMCNKQFLNSKKGKNNEKKIDFSMF